MSLIANLHDGDPQRVSEPFTSRSALSPTLAHPLGTALSVVRPALERFQGRPLALDAMYLVC